MDVVDIGSTEVRSTPEKEPVDWSKMLPTPESMEKTRAGLEEVAKKKAADTERITGETEKRVDVDRGMASTALDAAWSAAQKPQAWDADKKREELMTSPLEAFGSFASVFGIVASAFTRAPMENALNASASAMNAIKARDEKEYDRSFTAWKENTDLAVKRFNMQHSLYQDSINLMSTDLRAGTAKLENSALRFNDQQALVLIQNGMAKDLVDLIGTRARAAAGLMESTAKIDENVMRTQVFRQLQEQNRAAGRGEDPLANIEAFETAYGTGDKSESWLFRKYMSEKNDDGSERTAQQGIEFLRNMRTGVAADEERKRHNLEIEEIRKGEVELKREEAERKGTEAKEKLTSKPIPASILKDLDSRAGAHQQLSSLMSSFNPAYSGYVSPTLGEGAMWAARHAGIGNKEAAEWWQDYAKYRNVVRNKLFGSALTRHEATEWEKADINPGTQPDVLARNIERQNALIEAGLRRMGNSLRAQGYSRDGINAVLGIEIEPDDVKKIEAALPPPEIIKMLEEGKVTPLNTPTGLQEWTLRGGKPVRLPARATVPAKVE